VRVAVVGLGYVGLVTSACLADLGHEVLGVEVSAERIRALRAGAIPFHEPGLAELTQRNHDLGRLRFTDDPSSVAEADVVLIAVGTHDGNGGWQTGTIQSCLHDIVPLLADRATLVVRSTLPPAFLSQLPKIVSRIRQEAGLPLVPVLLNPEFTKEGTAVDDFLRPERVVIGVGLDIDGRGEDALRELYAETDAPIVTMSATNASLSKLGANLFLATKISFANELAQLCDLYGGDIDQVVAAMAFDSRIGGSFLRAGIGFGGSCLPHQVTMTVLGAAEAGVATPLFAAVDEVNHRQRRVLVDRLAEQLGGSLAGQRIALLGVTFKPDTDDLREAPSIAIARELIARGASVVTFDPMTSALDRFAALVPGVVTAASPLEALTDADGAALVTEWPVLRALDWNEAARVMRTPVIVDGRNALPVAALVAAGFDVTTFGRGRTRAAGVEPDTDDEPVAVMVEDGYVAGPSHARARGGAASLARLE
jgi:UDPglucose 6-dehydrogenase